MANTTPEKDNWKTLYQVLPEDVYRRLKVQLRRLAVANGVASEYFDQDSKFERAEGPRVAVWEMLVVLMERTESDETFRV
jgi:hypothetical protein